MSVHTPSDTEVLKAAIKGELGTLHTSFPAEIVSYSDSTGLAEIQPAIHIVNRDTRVATPRAIIPNVPVVFPQGSGVGIRWTPQTGDKVLCVVSERSIDRWIEDGLCADPQITRRHDMTDAICLPFSFEGNSPQTDGIYIDENGLVTVGVAAPVFVALASLVEVELTKILTAISGAGVTPGDGGAAFKLAITTALAGFPASTASSNLKAEP